MQKRKKFLSDLLMLSCERRLRLLKVFPKTSSIFSVTTKSTVAFLAMAGKTMSLIPGTFIFAVFDVCYVF